MPQQMQQQTITTSRCHQSISGVHLVVVSTGAGRVQRWLVGYVERWEGDEDGFVSKTFLRAGWHLHERTNTTTSEHPIPGLTYTAIDDFGAQATSHPMQRSHMESARRAIARLCKDGAFEESADRRSVRLPAVQQADSHLAKRLLVEREYLRTHGQSASDELLIAVTGNVVVVELERQLSPDERLSFTARSLERGDSPSSRVERLVDYVATKRDTSRKEVLDAAVGSARQAITTWREEDR